MYDTTCIPLICQLYTKVIGTHRKIEVFVLILGYSAVALIQFLDPNVLTPNDEGPSEPTQGLGSKGQNGLLGIHHV